MSIQVLDCTLRDGGYVNDWKFGKSTICAILDKLELAHLDIIECGFLTGMVQEDDCSLFSCLEEIEEVLPKRICRAMYVAMIAMGEKELHPNTLPSWNGKSIDGIRLTFHKGEAEHAIHWANIIMEKGYKVFMQPVGTAFYTDMELLCLVEKMNRLHPYAFYIVDTLGSMYRNEVSHKFYLIDENMEENIHLGFHPHNNLQLAFSNAQILGKIQTKRDLILDSSVYGMGRGAGNLPTELITQYINHNISSKYDVTMVMEIYDEYIAGIRKEFEWGYALPYHIAASHVCHPNYASYLLNKQTLTMKDIEKIIQTVPKEYRMLYQEDLICKLYKNFQSRKIDDRETLKKIHILTEGKKVLILLPGMERTVCYKKTMNFIKNEHPYVIAVNFADIRFPLDACFVNNHKKLDIISQQLSVLQKIQVIVTSNIPSGFENYLYVDYEKYADGNETSSSDAVCMLLRILNCCGKDRIYLAGFRDDRFSILEQIFPELKIIFVNESS